MIFVLVLQLKKIELFISMMVIIIGHLAVQPIISEDDKVNEFIFIHLGYFLSSFTAAASASATAVFSKKILQLLYDLLDIINYYFSTI